MNLKKIDKKLYMYLGIGFGIMIFLIIVILIINIMVGGRVSFEVAESKMQNAAIRYYSSRSDELPINQAEVKIEMETLVNAKLIKNFDRLLKEKDATCTGYVTIKNNNGNYLYSPYLDCGEKYKTTTLSSKIKENNPIATSGDGLYQMGENLVFRGEYVNNFVSFANKLWRIVRINSDDTLRMIEVSRKDSYTWDDRYNVEIESNTGINDYRVSRIKDTIEEIYNNEEEFSKTDKSYIVAQDVCLGKQSEDSNIIDGSIECSDILSNQFVSLLQVNEYVIASIDNDCKKLSDRQCSNYNYIAKFDKTFWTVTAYSEKSDRVFKISTIPTISRASNSGGINLVIHISKDSIYSSGDGTETNPYIIK